MGRESIIYHLRSILLVLTLWTHCFATTSTATRQLKVDSECFFKRAYASILQNQCFVVADSCFVVDQICAFFHFVLDVMQKNIKCRKGLEN